MKSLDQSLRRGGVRRSPLLAVTPVVIDRACLLYIAHSTSDNVDVTGAGSFRIVLQRFTDPGTAPRRRAPRPTGQSAAVEAERAR
jgi:hypothetical protein